MKMHKVEIVNDQNGYKPTHVLIDGKEVHGVRKVVYEKSVECFPIVSLDVTCDPEIRSIADIEIRRYPNSVDEALDNLLHVITEKYGRNFDVSMYIHKVANDLARMLQK